MNKNTEHELWSPNAAVIFGVVFTPIFSIYLHMDNWKTLGHHKENRRAKIWLIASIVVCFLPYFLPKNTLFYFSKIVFLLLWYIVQGRKQATFIKENLHKQYTRKFMTVPMVCAVTIIIVLLMVANTYSV